MVPVLQDLQDLRRFAHLPTPYWNLHVPALDKMLRTEQRADTGTHTQEDLEFVYRIRREAPAGSDLHTRAGRLLVKVGTKLPQ